MNEDVNVKDVYYSNIVLVFIFVLMDPSSLRKLHRES